jgi:hypothetical protein
VVGSPGDLYSDTAGGVSLTFYVKESGVATNIGWVVDSYAPAVPANWSPAPTTDAGALDQLALTNAPETFSSVMQPVLPVTAQATRALPAGALFEGGIYTCTKRVTLANLQMRATAATVGAVFRVAVYQRTNGTLGGALPLLFTADSPALAAGASNFVVPVPPGITLADGQYVVLVGRTGAALSLTLRVWSVPAFEMFTSVIPVAKTPYMFTTALSSLVAPPVTFDPVVSGVATALNVCPMMIGGS